MSRIWEIGRLFGMRSRCCRARLFGGLRGRLCRGCRCGSLASSFWRFRCLLLLVLALTMAMDLRISRNSSDTSVPAAEMMLCAPPGWPSRKAVPSYTSVLTTNQGFFSEFSLNSARSIILFTPSFFIFTSTSGSGSKTSSPACLSPQLPLFKSPPAFFTRSIQPPGPVGSVGCSKSNLPYSFVIVTRNQGLFIIPRTDQYMSFGWRLRASSIARTRSASLSARSETGISRDQKDQQKQVSRQAMSTRPP